MRHTSQGDNPDRSRDNLHREEPDNLNNLYGCWVEMGYPSWGQWWLPATRYAVIFKYCHCNGNKILCPKSINYDKQPLALTVYSIDLELEGFETPEESRFLEQYWKDFRSLSRYRIPPRTLHSWRVKWWHRHLGYPWIHSHFRLQNEVISEFRDLRWSLWKELLTDELDSLIHHQKNEKPHWSG